MNAHADRLLAACRWLAGGVCFAVVVGALVYGPASYLWTTSARRDGSLTTTRVYASTNGGGAPIGTGQETWMISTSGGVALFRPSPEGTRLRFRATKNHDGYIDIVSMLWPRTVDRYGVVLPYWLVGLVAYAGAAACWPRLKPPLGKWGVPRLSVVGMLLLTSVVAATMTAFSLGGELVAMLVGEAFVLLGLGYQLGTGARRRHN